MPSLSASLAPRVVTPLKKGLSELKYISKTGDGIVLVLSQRQA